ncbi:hypothetical protein AZ20_4208 [Bordetella bronchiseptica E014]|uniref:hypothetical protein n=2 Tax=Bordetella bronchiseptica TaxID=518 RepID=UPI000461E038|nr:hypothetical protein [Bordetella bronchiseptica]KDC22988.1 hypothetical protein AZ20_4208 [Bordetella bronchiseptica E014]KDC59193.1 hypothetical protein L511_4130 [Bordetella bronchiseptica MBORD595]
MIQENGALVEFYREAVQNNFKSAQEGRPIFDEKDFVRIQTPGDTRTVIERIASDQDKARFPRAWDMFSRGLEQAQEGTPLEQWNMVTRSQVKELKYVGVTTVEALASVSDGNIQRLGPGYSQLRRNAQAYLESSASDAKATAWAREKEAMEEQITQLQEQVKALIAAQEKSVDETAKRGPGRPRKEQE